ncbi:MAG: hypothetical protein Q4E05_09035 [Pseudoclavibacter sp.]|nr:hypothetical protein [Pseudoclavibacter sp.]
MSTEAVEAAPRTIARGAAAASLAVVPAAVAHGVADGHAVGPGTLCLTILLAGAVCVRLVGRRLSRLRIALAVLAAQGLLHAVFPLSHLGGSAVPGAGTAGHAGHGRAAAAAALAGLRTELGSAAEPGAAMLVGHLCAAAVTVLAAWYGRAACRRLAAAARRLLVSLIRLAGPVPAPPGPARVASPALRSRPVRTAQLPVLGIRGPPLPLSP